MWRSALSSIVLLLLVSTPVVAQTTAAGNYVDLSGAGAALFEPATTFDRGVLAPRLAFLLTDDGLTRLQKPNDFRSLRTARPERTAQRSASENRGWIGRHPALFGALAGAGLGGAATAVMENELFCSGGDEDCIFHGQGRVLVGAGIGAGIGAVVGWLAGRGAH